MTAATAASRAFAVVPAAGHSLRMGRPKLLLPWQGRTLLEVVLAQWAASPVECVVVVVRPDDSALAALCRGLPASWRIQLVQPPEAPAEMKESIACGLRHLARQARPRPGDVWLTAPADMPCWSSSVVRQLLEAWPDAARCGVPIVLPTIAGRRGHPLLLAWRLADEVLALSPDQGLNALVARHPVREVAVAEAGVLEDVDTPEAYQRLVR